MSNGKMPKFLNCAVMMKAYVPLVRCQTKGARAWPFPWSRDSFYDDWSLWASCCICRFRTTPTYCLPNGRGLCKWPRDINTRQSCCLQLGQLNYHQSSKWGVLWVPWERNSPSWFWPWDFHPCRRSRCTCIESFLCRWCLKPCTFKEKEPKLC